jgi:hypothetical protein
MLVSVPVPPNAVLTPRDIGDLVCKELNRSSKRMAELLNFPVEPVSKQGSLPSDAAARKSAPMAEGVLWYFPNALAAIAAVSKAGNDQHNPGQPMHHSRGKSSDHADCIMRHLVDAGTFDGAGMRHSAKVAWRALALLQEEIERDEGVPLPRNARFDTKEVNDRQVSTDPVSAGDRKVPLFPMGRRKGEAGDVGRDSGQVRDPCGVSCSDNGIERRSPCG